MQRLLAAERDLHLDTAAAIDRLVHHSVVIEMTGPSLRAEAAAQARK